MVGLGGLAFLAGGHHPGRGPYGKTVTRALQFVIAHEQNQPRPGFLYNPIGSNHGPMYSHGFATLFLAEAHGTITDRDLRQRVRDLLGRAVQVILNSQNGEGGWRVSAGGDQADISVTICQIMALRAAEMPAWTCRKVSWMIASNTSARAEFRPTADFAISSLPDHPRSLGRPRESSR